MQESRGLLKKSTAKVYFCDGYSLWQKPLIEKMDSIIHIVYPKNSDTKKLTKLQLEKIKDKLNNLPRRSFGYLMPNEVWHKNKAELLY